MGCRCCNVRNDVRTVAILFERSRKIVRIDIDGSDSISIETIVRSAHSTVWSASKRSESTVVFLYTVVSYWKFVFGVDSAVDRTTQKKLWFKIFSSQSTGISCIVKRSNRRSSRVFHPTPTHAISTRFVCSLCLAYRYL